VAQRTQLATAQTQFITQLNQDLVDSGLIDHANSNGQPTVAAGRQYETIPYVVMEVNSQTLPIVQQNALATSLELDVADKPALAQSLPLIGADKAWSYGYTGKGQTIAILDTGVEKSHPYFATNRIVQEACFSTTLCPNGSVTQIGGAGAAAPCTYDTANCPHGTHVAGIAASVAKEANLIAVQVFSKNFGLASSLKMVAPHVAGAWTVLKVAKPAAEVLGMPSVGKVVTTNWVAKFLGVINSKVG
jgi:subtilisin family serine protease